MRTRPGTLDPFAHEARYWSPRRRRVYLMLALALGGAAVVQRLADWQHHHALLINVSPSLPNWAFLLETRLPPARGSLVFFRPPVSPVLIHNFGAAPQLFGKYVYGVGGDVVTVSGRTFSVNGTPLVTAKTQSRRGEPLALGPTGRIPPGCYFVGSPHRDGFDSRYALIGWICRDRLVGTGTAIL